MAMSMRNLAILWLAAFGLASAFQSSAVTIRYTGVNLFGAEFGQQHLPGTYVTDYIYPNQTEVDYFKGKGMNIVRLPFRWERLQHTNNIALDSTELGRLNTFVSATTAKGVYVILDPHNFQRYYPNPNNFQSSSQGLVGAIVPDSVFTNFWSRVAAIYKTNNHVIFNLMNEPNTMPTEQLVASENAAIASIREAGATNLILVPGNGYTGAWTWYNNYYGTPNAVALLNIVDAGNNYAYDVHQYLDSDGSGTSTNIGSPTIGLERLANFTNWLHHNNKKGFLGEFAVADVTIGGGIGDEAINNMLAYVETNADVWLGWTWWAAGPYYTSYMFSLEPVSGDRPQMAVLVNHVPIPVPTLTLTSANRFQFTAQQGLIYQTETASDPAGGAWTNYGPSTNRNDLSVAVTMPVASSSREFFRVRVSHAP